MHKAGSKIREHRKAQRQSAQAFGKAHGFPAQTVYGWERGKIATPVAMRRLADAGICEPGDWLTPAEEAA